MRARRTKRVRPIAIPITNATTAGVYDGAELGRTCMRPGAYDAHDLPSLIGARRQYPLRRDGAEPAQPQKKRRTP